MPESPGPSVTGDRPPGGIHATCTAYSRGFSLVARSVSRTPELRMMRLTRTGPKSGRRSYEGRVSNARQGQDVCQGLRGQSLAMLATSRIRRDPRFGERPRLADDSGPWISDRGTRQLWAGRRVEPWSHARTRPSRRRTSWMRPCTPRGGLASPVAIHWMVRAIIGHGAARTFAASRRSCSPHGLRIG